MIDIKKLIRLIRGKRFTLTCGPGIEAEKTSYREGAKVTLKVHTVFDEMADMYIDGEILQSGPGSDDDWYVYTFTMPSHDVRAECVYTNISAVSEEDEASEVLLISCYGRVVGTPVEQPFERVRLFREPDGSLLLTREYGLPGDLETSRYTVTENCLEDAMDYILSNGMDKWPDLDECDPIDGYYGSCGFLLDGKWISLDTESPMPERGHSILGGVRGVLMRHAEG